MKKLIITALLAISASSWAQTTVKVEDAWVRGTVAAQKATGAFMRLTTDKDVRLVGVRTPIAAAAEIHEMSMDKDVMKMRQVNGLALTAGKPVELKPGGFHVMLLDLKGPLKAGDMVALTLEFEGAGKLRFTQEIQVPVRALGSMAPSAEKHEAGHKH
ncbi:copper chaperone PCu(A)C [Hydrogenophaga sp.]|uniref:copper chaperone PCu(A)C n=1 Tax=Hydrogenophaga sp. TaxID=1904254 RepID=UPI003567E9E3